MNMIDVKKRNGNLEEFDIKKIESAIEKTFIACKADYTTDIISLLALQVTGDFNNKIKNGVITVEEIQDSVENVLTKAGYIDIAKAYMSYRQQHQKVRDAKASLVDYKKLIDNYLKVNDWRVKENSTVSYSIGGLILSNSGAITANYWLSEIYDKEIADAHRNADMHIHDLSMLSGYCAGWSLKQLIQEGLGGVTGKITSKPASHLSTLCNQMVNFIGIMQNEWAGAPAFSSFDTYLAPFVKVDNLSYKEVKQAIQSFVFGLNTPSRWGTQSPFSNITLDWTVPDDLAYMPAIVGGKEQDFTYGDCKKEMDMINKAFIEVMIEGDANGRGFQYPIPTYSITKDFDWSETENNKLLFEMTAKYGTPYFSNYINSDMNPSDVRSMCLHPSTMVWIREGSQPKHITIEELYKNAQEKSLLISTRYGYRPIKELQQLSYKGDLLKFNLSNGTSLITTPDHEQVIYDDTVSRWYTDGTHKQLFKFNEQPNNWNICADNPGSAPLIKRQSKDIKVGTYLSSRPENAGTKRKGYTAEQYWGKEKAEEISKKHSNTSKASGRFAGKSNPAYGGLSDSWRQHISEALVGHPVSELCKVKSSRRWKGKNNPYLKAGVRVSGRNATISSYENEFAKELESLGLEYKYQYHISGIDKIGDFYIPAKNLIIELETDYRNDICAYNSTNNIYMKSLKEKYDAILSQGYNLLVFNPKKDNSSYRSYINSSPKVISIEKIPYDGYVYDLEVNCDDVTTDVELHHTFYANGILTGNCCRLRLDLRELRKKSGGYFGSGESTGSIGVVTLNMPRLAYLSKDKNEFYDRLVKLMDIAARSLHVKRQVITQYLEEGLYPYTKRYLGNFNNHFSTIGLVGMNEACLNAKWLKKDLTHKESQDFTTEVLNFMRNRLSDYQELYKGELFNLEATPAESTAYRLAKHDKEKYPDIITAGKEGETPYYTNSSHLPVGYTDDIFSALDIEDKFQTLYTSGTVFHAFLGQRLPNWQGCMKLVRKIAENYKLPYFTMSPTYSICPDHGYLEGEQWKCPICDKETEVYSRITGYYRPIKNWNEGKTQEFADRKTYNI